MAPLFLLISLCLTPFVAAAHTESFVLVQNLARQARVDLDLTGKQSYAIYETIPVKGVDKILPFHTRRGVVNGRVRCDENGNCDFVGALFQMDTGGSVAGIVGGKTSARVETPWKLHHDYDRKTNTYANFGELNKYEWAGPTKRYTDQQIYGFAVAWCRNLFHRRYDMFMNNDHQFARALYNQIKENKNAM
ncbi:uncharacterized protein PgNI_09257 [Pyricularia grisea]|uniref:Secreted protein n=1 Tax=Pyricularia grisea TaxID=148305 RepID=A0A6P8ATM3_PYRGI|nr:uncharacterized protein PgNI_09257 [Pyricularia grisea]TLD05484.1 hypothetical protein PgNI_09257 [Pyricularia grisea]